MKTGSGAQKRPVDRICEGARTIYSNSADRDLQSIGSVVAAAGATAAMDEPFIDVMQVGGGFSAATEAANAVAAS